MVRRFEFIEGNQAKFWEVARKGAVLTVSSGKIGGSAKTRTKQLGDFMAAEQEFDRLIRDKLRRGYKEVEEASAPPPPLPDRTLSLEALESDEKLELKASGTRYLVWRLVEVGALDNQEKSPNLGRWASRASRRLRLTEVPDEDTQEFDDFWNMYLDLSRADRAAESKQHLTVGAYKFTEGSNWIVTAKEANMLAEAGVMRTPKRHKISANQQSWLDKFVAFNELAAKAGGYTVVLVDEK